MSDYILSLSCQDKLGIVAAVAGLLAKNSCNIVESAQFTDHGTGQFFMRLTFEAPDGMSRPDALAAFRPVANEFGMNWHIHDAKAPAKVIIMVSKFDHCLIDLMYRVRVKSLPMDVVGIISNHDDCRFIAERNKVPFYHWPVSKENKQEAEQKMIDLFHQENADLIILARYMQILSDETCEKLSGKVINIHHSFLPSFKGAKPYHRAHERGVKLIGATAHYVTGDLDEGPIIEQDIHRVTHSETAKELVAIGRDIECRALARAVRYHVEHRVFLNGMKTVVFP